MLKKESFWSTLNAEKVLIFQADSIMLRSGIEKFLKYDYIGAPWDLRSNRPALEAFNNKVINEIVGNGGFSLRTTSVMINISNKYSHLSPFEEPEDLFFSGYVLRLGYSYPSAIEAFEFSREVGISINGSEPRISHMALHSPAFYMRENPNDAADYMAKSVPVT